MGVLVLGMVKQVGKLIFLCPTSTKIVFKKSHYGVKLVFKMSHLSIRYVPVTDILTRSKACQIAI